MRSRIQTATGHSTACLPLVAILVVGSLGKHVVGEAAPAQAVVAIAVSAMCIAAKEQLARRLQVSPIKLPLLSSLELVLATAGTERRATIRWEYSQVKYSLTVPSESVAAALVATVAPDFADETLMTFFLPEDRRRESLKSGVPSFYADVPTEEATKFILELRFRDSSQNYTVAVLRSTITSSYEFAYPDPAEGVPPQATLVGLGISDTYGAPARMTPAFFKPQHSQYIASVDPGVAFARVVASQNDPEATLQMRINGESWLPLTSGIGAPLQAVPERGWLLFEIKVISPGTVGASGKPLVYQVVIAQQLLCHKRCRSCFGPGEDHCLRCRAPLVLFEGHCDTTACPPDGYYEWRSHQCRRCDAGCAACTGPGTEACTLCPALSFLLPQSWDAPSGPCVGACPGGTFAHPPSRRCRVPPAVVVKTWYVRFLFRDVAVSFEQNKGMRDSVVNTTAFVLGLSLSDVRLWRIDDDEDTGMGRITIEVISPFLSRPEADRISIDTWFGAFDVPVDIVTTHTWDEMHPPPPAPKPEPWLPTWALGLGVSVGLSLVVLLPLYWLHFRRLANTKRRYSGRRGLMRRTGVDPTFIPAVMDKSPAWLIRRFIAKDSGKKLQLTNGRLD